MARNIDRGLFGAWLTARRKARFATQGEAIAAFQEVARARGHDPRPMRQSRWSDMERGQATPTGDDLAVLEELFGTDWPRPPMPLDYERQMRALLAEALRPTEELLLELVATLRQRER